jgi:hypothetical protein
LTDSYIHKTKCLGLDLDGNLILLAWGNDINNYDYLEQAKINAFKDVLFKGIYEGKNDCDNEPIVKDVNADEKYSKYFSKFFSQNGLYKIFIKVNKVYENNNQINNGVELIILKKQLKNRLISDGIIK